MNKIIFAGTPDIAAGVLESLIQARFNVIACLTQPDRPQGRGLKLTPSAVKTSALQHNIPVLQPVSLKNQDIQQQLIDLQPDIMIVMAYGLILPQAVLDIPKLGCINIHASILPRWRGAAPIQHAILSGDKESGITIMQMNSGLDTGDILSIYPCIINATDTSADLYERLAQLAPISCIDALHKLEAGQIIPQQQADQFATYAHKIDKAHAKIDWSLSAIEIDRCIRGYNSWPIAFTTLHDQTVRIWKAELIADAITSVVPGTIISVDPTGIRVATSDGTINILEMQFPGKKVLPVAAICNAHKDLTSGAHFV